MTDLHSFLRDLDDGDDFPVNSTPLVFGYDSTDMPKDLVGQMKDLRDCFSSSTSPLGRSAASWANSGLSRVPSSNDGKKNHKFPSAPSSAALAMLQSRTVSMDAMENIINQSSFDSSDDQSLGSQSRYSNSFSSKDSSVAGNSMNSGIAMMDKFSLSFFVHEISKLMLHTKDVNAQYRKMKEDLINVSFYDVLSLAYQNTITTMFRNQDIYNNIDNARAGTFLYQTEQNERLAKEYELKKEEIIKKCVQYQQGTYDFMNDIYLYPKNNNAQDESSPSSTITFETFIENHDHIGMLYTQIFLSPTSDIAIELSKSFFSTWMWNVKIVLVSLARQRKTLLPSATMSNRGHHTTPVATDAGSNRSNAENGDDGYASSMTVHTELESTIINARYLFALVRFANMNGTRVMKNGREYDNLLQHYHGHHRNTSTTLTSTTSNPAIYPHAKFTRTYTGTILMETETIQVVEDPPFSNGDKQKCKTQYIRSLDLQFDERKKKNDVNTTFFSDETNLYMMLCYRFQRENISIGLFRNILTSKKLAMTYYSSNEYVLQALFKFFLNEVVKYPSYLILHAMIFDLIEGIPIGGLSPTITASSAANDDNMSVSSASSTGGSSMKSGASMNSQGSGKVGGKNDGSGNNGLWSWSKLVPRKKLDSIPSINTSNSAIKAVSIHSNQAMRDYLIDDVLLPIAIEGVDNANKELLCWYNTFSKMTYFFDEASLPSGQSQRNENDNKVVDLKWLLIDKEHHIISTWLLQRGHDLSKSPLSDDPAKLSTFLIKQLLPRLADLCNRWYGINLYDTFDHLRANNSTN